MYQVELVIFISLRQDMYLMQTDKYFKVTEDELPIYDNRTGIVSRSG